MVVLISGVSYNGRFMEKSFRVTRKQRGWRWREASRELNTIGCHLRDIRLSSFYANIAINESYVLNYWNECYLDNCTHVLFFYQYKALVDTAGVRTDENNAWSCHQSIGVWITILQSKWILHQWNLVI
jgi:hypothetical protein